jgi:DNA mismatch repair protein MutL
MIGRYPIAILFITMPPESVDVNVHPTKAEVRFGEPERVFMGVQRAVRRALLAHTPVTTIDGRSWLPITPGRAGGLEWEMGGVVDEPGRQDAQRAAGPGISQQPGLLSWESVQPEPASQPAVAASQGAPPAAASPPGARSYAPLLRLVGQVANAYLVAEGPDGLYLVDQHAAHERVLFEKMMASLNTAISAQALLEAKVVELSPSAAQLLEPQLEMLNRLGFVIEPFGNTAFLVRAIPGLLAGSDPAAAVRVVVEDFEEDETPLQAEREARLIARICKRAAVKAGKALSPAEGAALLHELTACQSPRTCPHGRPTMIHLSVDLLERQFGRRGAR